MYLRRMGNEQKTIVITGAASGLGRGLAARFLVDGARVIGLDVNARALNIVADELGAHFIPMPCDLLDTASIRSAADAIREQFGAVSVLVNNAGIVAGKHFLDLEDGDVERVFGVNVFAPFTLTRLLLPDMIAAGGGHVVTIASAGGLVATARMAPYAASKFAAFGFDEALRIEMQREGHPITTTVVCPFYINTGMFDGVKTRLPWLLPILDERYAVKRIYSAIQRRKARLIMPRFVYSVFLVRMLPVAFADRLLRWLGIASSMDEFRGR